MQKGYTNNISFKIAFTGMMLSLVILFQYLEKFMPIMDLFVKINLSIVFIMTAFYIVGWEWAMTLLLIRFFIGPAISSYGYSTLSIWSHFILLTMGFIYMMTFVLIHKFIFKKYSTNKTLLLIISLTSTIIIVSLIGAFLNAILFSPVYWYIMGFQKDISISASVKSYEYVKYIHFFGIPNYWAGMFAAFGLGNLIKYSVVSTIFVALWKVIKHYEK